MRPKENTQKNEALEFYYSYEGEKVTWSTFYRRVRSQKNTPREELIKSRLWARRKPRNVPPKGKWAKEMLWFDEQQEPKATKSLFRNRLNGGYPKEKAILIGEAREKVKAERKLTHPIQTKAYVPQRRVPQVEDENNFLIKVTYPKEVARVFRKEYLNMIEQLERELTYTADKTETVSMNKKIERLHKELECFNQYNK